MAATEKASAEKVAVHILENILNRQRYGSQVLEDITGAIERSGFFALDAKDQGPDYRAQVRELERENEALKQKVKELRKPVPVKPEGTKYDGDYYRGVAERHGSKIAAIKKILST